MAVKKETAQQAAEAATQDTKDVQAEKRDTEVIHLFKDNGRYSSARFVSVNGEAYLIQRGVDVEVPAAVAEVLRHSEEMDNAANAKIEAAQAAAQNVPALQKLSEQREENTRYGRHLLCRVFLLRRRNDDSRKGDRTL